MNNIRDHCEGWWSCDGSRQIGVLMKKTVRLDTWHVVIWRLIMMNLKREVVGFDLPELCGLTQMTKSSQPLGSAAQGTLGFGFIGWDPSGCGKGITPRTLMLLCFLGRAVDGGTNRLVWSKAIGCMYGGTVGCG